VNDRETTCGEALVRLLEAYGVERVFGIPGVHTLGLYRGLAGSPIEHVLARHEQGAAFMADGYARAGGRPGVCFLITGPGVTNAATAVAQAYSDSVPLLVLAAVNARRDLGLGRGRLHEMADQRASAAGYCGLAATVPGPAEIAPLLARAFAGFATGRPRPVHLELPIDLLDESAPDMLQPPPLPAPPRPDPAAVTEAARLLEAAQRPVILAGGGALRAAPWIAALAERLAAPLLTTVAGKGLIDPAHPLHAGAILATAPGRALLAGADAALVLGSELAETDLWAETLPLPAALVRVDLDPAKLADDHAAAVPILAEAGATAEALLAALGEKRPDPGAAIDRVRAARAEALAAEGPLQRLHLTVLQALRAALPPETIVASDMTQIAYTANAWFELPGPRQWLHPVGYGTLGYALPAAIGAKLARPEAPVLAIAGDAGFLYTGQELATAVELRLPLPVLLWDNDGLGQIRDDMRRRGLQEIGVSPRNPDYPALARAYGAAAEDLESLDGLAPALTAAFARPGPTLIRLRQTVTGSGG